MEFTVHAAKQAQRRGVNSEWIECVLQYGEVFKGGGGCSLYRIPARERRFLKSENPQAWKNGRDHHKVALIVAGDAIVTVMHRMKSPRNSNRIM